MAARGQRVRERLVELYNTYFAVLPGHGTLRQELESDLKHRIVPIARVAALEEQLTARAGEMDGLLAAFQTSNQEAKTVQGRMTALESRFEQIDRNARSITGTLTEMWEDATLWPRAQALADDLRATHPRGALEETREALARF